MIIVALDRLSRTPPTQTFNVSRPHSLRMSWLVDLIPSSDTRLPLTPHSFFHDLLPPFLCYYTTAILVLLPRTLILRLTLLPLTLWLAFRGGMRLDLSSGCDRLVYLNIGLAIILVALSMRVITWSFQRQPFRRVKTLAEATPQFYNGECVEPITSFKQLAADASDLCCNMRGCGWNWAPHLQIPSETRPTKSTVAFVTATAVSLAQHLFFFDILHYGVQWFAPLTVGSPKGGTIFDSSLPPAHRYLRSTIMTTFSGLVVYCGIQAGYHVFTIIGVVVFEQDPSLWPPAFNAPWLSTSLAQFWAKRWHQVFRDVFVSLGGHPLSLIAGRAGAVLGSFFVSAILHDMGVYRMGNYSDFRHVGGFFIINGVGVLVEHVWRKVTGSRVCGFFGWLWTITWVIGWGHLLIDAWARKGLIGSRFFPTLLRPSTILFGPLPGDTI